MVDLENIPNDLITIVSIVNHRDLRLRSSLAVLKEIIPKMYLAISKNYLANEKSRNKVLIQLANEFNLALIATNNVLYHKPQRKVLQDVLTCIRIGKTINQAGLSLEQNSERHLKSAKQIEHLFKDFPQAIKNTAIIAEKASSFSLEELRYEYPEEICPKGEKPQEYLESLTRSGALKRYPSGLPNKVKELLEHEFKLIADLNYAKYFLTVYKIVSFARSKNILCQGRGAAANSAVCYCLGITAVDPSRTRLLIERFISKERGEPPDIDIDFEHERREEVIQYIYKTFGRRRAALICEVVTYRMKSSIREVGKVLGLTNDTIKNLQRLYYRRANDESPSYQEVFSQGLNPQDPNINQTLSLASEIRGFPRHLSQHVGGFVISQEPLSNIVPIENAAMPERTVIEWDKDDIELMGMLKIDVLGLGMLTCIRKALELVNQKPGQTSKLELYTVPAEDPEVYKMLTRAETIGIFQIESRAQMTMLPRLKPKCFFDLVIEVAIVRPGPIQGGMVHPYLRRRSGKEAVSYPNQKIKNILENTLGVPIFQEQIMEIAVAGAGFSPGEADQLRRAIASWKRNKESMSYYSKKLVQGLLRTGHEPEFAEQIFRQIKGFAEYGFPQSHAASFAILVYASAWLKFHHPAVFTAALLNSQPMGFYRPSQIIEDAKRHGVGIKAIDANYSNWDCILEGKNLGELRLGFRLVKGLEAAEAKKLVKAVHSHGQFSSLKELWRKSSLKISALQALARADCFASMRINRQQALWQLKALKEEALPLLDLIEEKESIAVLPELSKAQEVLFDYEFYGHSLKAHPLSFYREKLIRLGLVTIAEFKNSKHGSKLRIAGLSVIKQKPPTAKGVFFITVEDESGLANIIFKPKIYQKYRLTIISNNCLVFCGKVQKIDGVINLLAEGCYDIKGHVEELNLKSRDFH